MSVVAEERKDRSNGAGDRDVEMLEELPAVAPLIAKAALTARGRPGSLGGLPGRRVLTTGVRVQADRLADYSHLCGMTLRNEVPATYLHVLTFPLQVHLMAARDFPFRMAGMVHVANSMTLHRPVDLSEPLTLSSAAADIRPHRRGSTVDLLGRAEVGGETVWEGTSTYLVRSDSSPQPARQTAQETSATGEPADPPGSQIRAAVAEPLRCARWRLPADLGRRYARVSGDVNPIHLHPLAAKAFGFPRAIAHGMWTHARVFGALEGRLAPRHTVSVDFVKPVLLPSTVDFGAVHDQQGWRFAVSSDEGARTHLTGTVTVPDGDPSLAPAEHTSAPASDDFTQPGGVV